MIPRPDLRTEQSPGECEIFQLTNRKLPACHIYMEAQIFTPDSKRLILHEAAAPHGGLAGDPRHRYLLCDLENHGELIPLTDEPAVTAPSLSPDGQLMYYFTYPDLGINQGSFALKRVNLNGTGRETIAVIDAPLPGGDAIPSKLYPLSTIASDGRHIAISTMLSDGENAPPDNGILVFDTETGDGEELRLDPDFTNIHPQYCRSSNPTRKHDLMIQHDHGRTRTVTGEKASEFDRFGVDIHLIRDDGTNLRDLPVGRDGREYCQGHQCWRGEREWGMVGTGKADPKHKHGWGGELVECLPANFVGHLGKRTPGATRNVISDSFPGIPDFHHFQTERTGQLLITDCGPSDEGCTLWLARLDDPGKGPARDWIYLLDIHTANCSAGHPHPFLSPDGSKGFFNSTESGVLQAYMVTNLESIYPL